MGKVPDKTNVMRLLDQADISYTPHYYDPDTTAGVSVAELLGQPKECLFKTLVTESADKRNFVFVVPVNGSLDLKKAARAAGVKSIAMIKQKELLPLTGYIHGGCSPIGMKKPFPTYIDETALITDRFFCSAGRVGAQIEVNAVALAEYIGAEFVDLTEE